MKRLFLLLFLTLLLAGCDDDGNESRPDVSLDRSSIAFAGIAYSVDLEAFTAQVTVTVLDESGAPVAGRAVIPASGMEDATFDPENAVTGSDGVATFIFSTGHQGPTTFSAEIGATDAFPLDAAVTLDSTTEATFAFDVDIIPLAATYSPDSGSFSLRATLNDDSGVITGASGTVADASGVILFSPDAFTTDGNGRAVLSADTSQNGTATLRFSLAGIAEPSEVVFNFAGPMITGQIANTQHYHPLGFHAARVSLMALNMLDRDTIDLTDPLRAEMHSETTCPCPGPVEYELELPIAPDPSLLTHDATLGIDFGIFVVVVYDDLNEDYSWNEGEPLIAARLDGAVLHYALDAGGAFEHLGWSIVDRVGSDPEFLDWESEKDFVDISVTRAPLYEPTVEGTVVSTQTSDTRVLWAMVDAAALPGGYTPPEPLMMSHLAILDDPADYQVLGDFDAPLAGWSAPLPDVRTEMDTATIDAWKFTFGTSLGDVQALLLVGVLYLDADQSGDYSAGDTLLGMAHEQFDRSSVYWYVLDYPNYAMFVDPEDWWFHGGYNHLQTARRIEIASVDFTGGVYTITLATGASAGNTTGGFVVLGQGAAFDSAPEVSGTYSADLSQSDVVTIDAAGCTGCSNLSAGDQFIFLLDPVLAPPAYTFSDLHQVFLID